MANELEHDVDLHNDEVEHDNAFDTVNVRRPFGIERISPRTGKKYYKPDVPLSLRPEIGMIFPTLDEAYKFYERYAKEGGFTVRKNTQVTKHGVISLKYLVCSKEGHKPYYKIDTLKESNASDSKEKKRRNRASIRTGCPAHIRFQICDNNKYKVYGFFEDHNHAFVDADDYHMLCAARKLSYNDENLIYSLSKLNIGPVKAFNIMRTHCGGFEEVGMTAVDCKNFKRDLNLYIGKHDAEMVVQRLTLKKKYNPDFLCDYFTTDEGNLGGLFWADEVMKRNFIMFGDVVAFDATYRSNKYDMVFVPFTGIDNHHRNVTLGAALLGSETAEAYTWLLKAFKKAFGAVPRVVVTDQDLAMKKAIRDVFTTSRHRLCMWHIMKKLAEKVGVTIRRDTTFKRRLCDIVWTDSIEPIYFESKWMEIIRDFNLTGNKWLTDMYAIRNDWIPAYYRHEHMSGLMRTTSRSESENHFFGQVANSSLTLVEFLSHFDTAIESQRYTHRKNDHLQGTQPLIGLLIMILRRKLSKFIQGIYLKTYKRRFTMA
ncbi:putative transcription factor FAR family [Helianthus debilis subsp. tardiflorus]